MKSRFFPAICACIIAIIPLTGCEEETPEPVAPPATGTEPTPEPPAATDPPMAEKPADPPKKSSEGYISADLSTFSAWRNLMPGPGPNPTPFHIKGTIQVASGSYNAELKARKGSPTDFDVIVTNTGEPGIQAISDVELHYNGSADGIEKMVTVHFPDGKSHPLPVEDVH